MEKTYFFVTIITNNMQNLHKTLTKLIWSNLFIKTWMSHKLFNLSKLAIFLKVPLEIQLKKTVSVDSIHMQLSRIQRASQYQNTDNFSLKLSGVNIQSNLSICILFKNQKNNNWVLNFSLKIRENNWYFIITESRDKITIIFEDEYLEEIENYIEDEPIGLFTNISGISSKFQRDHKNESWFLFALTQQMYFQNISIVEVISSDTEIIFYVNATDAKRWFDTIFENVTNK